ncbi:cob(I)yrinic acid a,c-diamide adenosyltransferase, partial [Candidatus Gottesmanbacteria bacterium]|nr:cob(I)yrinic acid a,c-diamide adenosyltransferase [Candidatus Gottesmanbacteria bacterium]
MLSKVKIYTRTGDKGETSLYGGKRVSKNSIRIEAYGSIDELNSLLGIVSSFLADKRAEGFINQIQKDLFLIGSCLAGAKVSIERLKTRVWEMEKVIDSLDGELPPLSNFILPEGIERATFVYFARAVARRAERKLVALSAKEPVDKRILIYLNRLSDLLFILGRYLNFKSGV